MDTIYKPRGPKKPTFIQEGIRPNQLALFLRDAQMMCQDKGEMEASFRLECLVDYFEKNYVPDQPLVFKGRHAGF
jgi:hypothetical protein